MFINSIVAGNTVYPILLLINISLLLFLGFIQLFFTRYDILIFDKTVNRYYFLLLCIGFALYKFAFFISPIFERYYFIVILSIVILSIVLFIYQKNSVNEKLCFLYLLMLVFLPPFLYFKSKIYLSISLIVFVILQIYLPRNYALKRKFKFVLLLPAYVFLDALFNINPSIYYLAPQFLLIFIFTYYYIKYLTKIKDVKIYYFLYITIYLLFTIGFISLINHELNNFKTKEKEKLRLKILNTFSLIEKEKETLFSISKMLISNSNSNSNNFNLKELIKTRHLFKLDFIGSISLRNKNFIYSGNPKIIDNIMQDNIINSLKDNIRDYFLFNSNGDIYIAAINKHILNNNVQNIVILIKKLKITQLYTSEIDPELLIYYKNALLNSTFTTKVKFISKNLLEINGKIYEFIKQESNDIKIVGMINYKLILNCLYQLYSYYAIFSLILIIALIYLGYSGLQKLYSEIESKEKILQNIINSVNDLIFYTDKQGNLLLANKFFYEFFQLSPDKQNINIFSLLDYKESSDLLKNDFNGKINIKEIKLKDNEGNNRYFSFYKIPVTNIFGEIYALIFYGKDFTLLKNYEFEIIRKEKFELISTLVSGLVHDLNNMINALLMHIYVLKTKESNEEKINYLKSMEEICQNINKLNKQMLSISKDEILQKKEIDLNSFIQNKTKLILVGKHVKVHFLLPEEKIKIMADEIQLTQVLSNLLINAIEAMNDNGNIYINVKKFSFTNKQILHQCVLEKGDYVEISITDEGKGIDEKIINKIFDPFFTTKKKGNGLGLAMTYRIIKNHNGCIAVKSEINKGTTFYIYLPLK
ncbi:GHKL domain-containing protein [Deferribacter autotrophicus]|uniref:histidine kinase n=1 Tax=Deferribacter autotrophicus TaxID=500465 RepID=A0A5A8F5D4_9BACT|nr:ATP-binding protein [Deferribacter autotrophicus]KAA0259336.1 GHKL domain-containing protein [Deferribacter autotrophicus]